ncbi:hypothetical protein J8273_2781 [Carpediemonas membranifera]|uniref:Uncharacterized protein n=1 Tax=Carpediemonas membranifera TaxID=201153 RepID=A0A8J6BZJ1_9EUKA|nr:hypothetical protein J8273_2781 [Carpediemonas membranifera]|eukprot:KAG9395586.1 hypothetical protein J8273_2781 [Carpediemonas membranifera]
MAKTIEQLWNQGQTTTVAQITHLAGPNLVLGYKKLGKRLHSNEESIIVDVRDAFGLLCLILPRCSNPEGLVRSIALFGRNGLIYKALAFLGDISRRFQPSREQPYTALAFETLSGYIPALAKEALHLVLEAACMSCRCQGGSVQDDQLLGLLREMARSASDRRSRAAVMISALISRLKTVPSFTPTLPSPRVSLDPPSFEDPTLRDPETCKKRQKDVVEKATERNREAVERKREQRHAKDLAAMARTADRLKDERQAEENAMQEESRRTRLRVVEEQIAAAEAEAAADKAQHLTQRRACEVLDAHQQAMAAVREADTAERLKPDPRREQVRAIAEENRVDAAEQAAIKQLAALLLDTTMARSDATPLGPDGRAVGAETALIFSKQVEEEMKASNARHEATDAAIQDNAAAIMEVRARARSVQELHGRLAADRLRTNKEAARSIRAPRKQPTMAAGTSSWGRVGFEADEEIIAPRPNLDDQNDDLNSDSDSDSVDPRLLHEPESVPSPDYPASIREPLDRSPNRNPPRPLRPVGDSHMIPSMPLLDDPESEADEVSELRLRMIPVTGEDGGVEMDDLDLTPDDMSLSDSVISTLSPYMTPGMRKGKSP